MEKRDAGSITVSVLVAVILAGATASPLRADGLPPVQLTTELMMLAEGGDAGLIGLVFGPDSSSPLTFSSFVDPTATAFSYSLNPGATYEGLAMTLTGSGTFDSATGYVTFSSSGMLGSEAFTTSGSGSFLDVPNGITGTADEALSNLMDAGHRGRKHITEVIDNKDGTSIHRGYYVDEEGHQEPFEERDKWDPSSGDWDFGTRTTRTGGAFRSIGFSPVDGGAGVFTTTISATPEPATLLFFGSGLLGLSGVFRWSLRLNRRVLPSRPC